ncbi:flagellar protein FlaG [Pseudomonas sp. YuFO20]|jgi:flagellar protein FlaG|uniref:Flagellar protein FlaG n=1 Tax=Pseudomonas neuropathica TaxID=2730425 RepID=A0ACC7N0A0_9PSED|nr:MULTISPECIES: flagellar protein FlaG [Pseudomonas]MDD2100912.1 flagellar protein FlaG [Pseudomonas putida]MEB2516942.1 flagellar protein FlaG [Pseudomonas sp. YuFO20]
MDMSVKLTQSYPAVAPQGVTPNVTGKLEQPKAEAVKASNSEPKRDELEKAVTDIQEFVQAARRNLDFSIDDSTGRVVVKVIATETGLVIRQIPSEAALKLAQSLSDASSLLFDDKV